MRRRDLFRRLAALTVLPAALAAAPARGAAPALLDPVSWGLFQRRFVMSDGRIVDTGNRGISHSEGQGYGMLLALAAGDRDTFRRVHDWTRGTLAPERDDGLLAWHWVPRKGVEDRNNATDGDVLVAWATLLAGRLWRDAGLVADARARMTAIRRHAVVEQAGFTVLLPGVEGFRRDGSLVLNPSYWIYPALHGFAAVEPEGPWMRLAASGLSLLSLARFGPQKLPPDWLLLDGGGKVSLPEGFAARFGFDAIRVPLYLAWGGYTTADLYQPYVALAAPFQETGLVPATVELPSGTYGKDIASPGSKAVLALASGLDGGSVRVDVPPLSDKDDYYATVLGLLTRLAAARFGEGV